MISKKCLTYRLYAIIAIAIATLLHCMQSVTGVVHICNIPNRVIGPLPPNLPVFYALPIKGADPVNL